MPHEVDYVLVVPVSGRYACINQGTVSWWMGGETPWQTERQRGTDREDRRERRGKQRGEERETEGRGREIVTEKREKRRGDRDSKRQGGETGEGR